MIQILLLLCSIILLLAPIICQYTAGKDAPSAGELMFDDLRQAMVSSAIGCCLWTNVIHNLHTIPTRSIRKEWTYSNLKNVNITWEENYSVITRAGHHWCSLTRDDWICVGSSYGEKLSKTPHFSESLALFNLEKNSTVFFEGNSLLAERIYLWICETSYLMNLSKRFGQPETQLKVYKLGEYDTNNLMIYFTEPYNITVLILDNDYLWNYNTSMTVELFQKVKFIPNVIVLGHLNIDSARFRQGTYFRKFRAEIYSRAFPAAKIVFPRATLTEGCKAEFTYPNDCGSGGPHQCTPGPTLIPDTEQLAREVLQASIPSLHKKDAGGLTLGNSLRKKL